MSSCGAALVLRRANWTFQRHAAAAAAAAPRCSGNKENCDVNFVYETIKVGALVRVCSVYVTTSFRSVPSLVPFLSFFHLVLLVTTVLSRHGSWY